MWGSEGSLVPEHYCTFEKDHDRAAAVEDLPQRALRTAAEDAEKILQMLDWLLLR